MLARGLFRCLLTELWSNEANKHQNNPLVSAQTVRHDSTYIILFLTRHNEPINGDQKRQFSHFDIVSHLSSLRAGDDVTIIISFCPYVHPSVYLSVCLLTTLWEHVFHNICRICRTWYKMHAEYWNCDHLKHQTIRLYQWFSFVHDALYTALFGFLNICWIDLCSAPRTLCTRFEFCCVVLNFMMSLFISFGVPSVALW